MTATDELARLREENARLVRERDDIRREYDCNNEQRHALIDELALVRAVLTPSEESAEALQDVLFQYLANRTVGKYEALSILRALSERAGLKP